MRRGMAVGIDFGTTNSVVAQGTADTAAVIPTGHGHRVVPSVVSITEDGAVVGRDALSRVYRDPDHTVRAIKRDLGGEDAGVTGPEGTHYAPEQVVALVLQTLKSQAERRLDAPVTDAVIGVPAYFGHSRREVIHRGGEIAGLAVDSLVSEPTAACIGYDTGTGRGGGPETVLVYDLGGGTFDVSLVEIRDGVYDVVATSGHILLGGRDWDGRIVDWLLETVVDDPGSLANDRFAIARLRGAAKRAKHDLSERESTTITVPFLRDDRSIEAELTRETFEERTMDLVEGTIEICQDLVSQVDWNAWTIDEVLLVGGATRMPMIREAVYEFFGQVPSSEVNPDEVVALGAAVRAASSVGEGAADGEPSPLPAGNTTSGTSDTADADVTAADDGPRSASAGDIVLLDVVPKSLGIETVVDGERGRFSPVIERNTSIPAGSTKRYWTVRDGQRRIRVRVYQGDADRVVDNEFLGEFELRGIPPGPAGDVTVTVRFELDENGFLSVSAGDTESGATEEITIDTPFKHDDEEVRRMRATLPEISAGDLPRDRETKAD